MACPPTSPPPEVHALNAPRAVGVKRKMGATRDDQRLVIGRSAHVVVGVFHVVEKRPEGVRLASPVPNPGLKRGAVLVPPLLYVCRTFGASGSCSCPVVW